MSFWRLVLDNLFANRRNLSIFFCVAGLVFALFATTVIIRGNQNSLDAGIKRLGADIIVVLQGSAERIEMALLTGKPVRAWMPASKLDEIASVPGVEQVSPQIFLQSLYGASCCSVSEMFLVVFDPATDFTLRPWLETELKRDLAPGEVIGGSFISADAANHLFLYGYRVTLAGNLEQTGTGIDQSLFMSIETARDIAASSLTTAQSPLEIKPDQVSALMVKTSPDADPHQVAESIALNTSGVVPVESPSMFGSFRSQVTGLLWGAVGIVVIFFTIAVYLIGLILSSSASERRREVAVLRALGASRNFVFLSLLSEASILALAGGLLGIVIASVASYLFCDFISSSLGIPFLFPELPSWLLMVSTGALITLAVVTLAAFFPAYRMSRQEPALAVRE
jgi:putative ABC transport system permease protein